MRDRKRYRADAARRCVLYLVIVGMTAWVTATVVGVIAGGVSQALAG